MNDLVKFAVIGYGHIGKRYVELISNNNNALIAAICDIRPEVESEIKNFIPYFNTVEELLASGIEMDIVCVATPNGLHKKHALAVLNANKHVVIEKPLALSKVDCEKILYKSLKMHKQVFCVMQNRYSPPSMWLKKIIDEGLLGKVFMVQVNCYWNRDDRYYKKGGWKGTNEMDGGTLFTQFSHFIDIMYWLFGDIDGIKAKFNDFTHTQSTDFEDSGFVMFDFVKGGMGSINFSTSVWDKNLESSMTVIAENGSLKIGGQYMNEVEQCHIKNYTMPQLGESNPANDYGSFKGSASNHNFIIENVIDVIRGKSTITTNALEGLKVVEIIERIYKLRDNK